MDNPGNVAVRSCMLTLKLILLVSVFVLERCIRSINHDVFLMLSQNHCHRSGWGRTRDTSTEFLSGRRWSFTAKRQESRFLPCDGTRTEKRSGWTNESKASRNNFSLQSFTSPFLYLSLILQIRDHTWTLIKESVVPSDEGNYTCVVQNRHGTLQHTYQLNVIGKIICSMYTRHTACFIAKTRWFQYFGLCVSTITLTFGGCVRTFHWSCTTAHTIKEVAWLMEAVWP